MEHLAFVFIHNTPLFAQFHKSFVKQEFRLHLKLQLLGTKAIQMKSLGVQLQKSQSQKLFCPICHYTFFKLYFWAFSLSVGELTEKQTGNKGRRKVASHTTKVTSQSQKGCSYIRFLIRIKICFDSQICSTQRQCLDFCLHKCNPEE